MTMEQDSNLTSLPQTCANISNSSSAENADCCINFFLSCTSQWTTECTRQLVMGVITSILTFLVIVVNGGIVVYENEVADTYRTLINKGVALMSQYNMLIATTVVPVTLSNNFCLKLNSTFCTVHLIVSLTILLQVILVHNELAILLNWSTWSIGRVQGINEDIGKKILSAINLVLSIFFSLIMCLSFGKQDIFIYRLCTGDCSGKPKLCILLSDILL